VTKRRTPGPPRRYWTAAELERLAKLYPERPTAEVAKTLGRGIAGTYNMAKKLGLQKSEGFRNSDLSGRVRKGHAARGERTRFVKGQTPANKGLRRPGYAPGRMKETQFKKGQRSGVAAKNWVPIGTILPDPEGYLHIKVREALPGEYFGYPNKKAWPLLHHQVWKEHKGPIPPKHLVVFKDKDRSNCAIDNLELISMADNARRNSMWATMPRELAEVMQLNGALKRKLRSIDGKKQDQRPEGSPVRDARSVERSG
jgi:hypothetical protein